MAPEDDGQPTRIGNTIRLEVCGVHWPPTGQFSGVEGFRRQGREEGARRVSAPLMVPLYLRSNGSAVTGKVRNCLLFQHVAAGCHGFFFQREALELPHRAVDEAFHPPLLSPKSRDSAMLVDRIPQR